jgi:D-alanyl-D-alanine carboxypeptidase/D-alanyl-D-alanine-endopeptidase (penicillin-binding protein 4)
MTGVRLYDGSGLSRGNRLTAAALVALLGAATSASHPELRAIHLAGGLPVAGLTGTLRAARGRFATPPSSCAVGRLAAKTGHLSDVVTLAGVATGADGRPKTFAILLNGRRSTLATKQWVDGLAATITGCW